MLRERTEIRTLVGGFSDLGVCAVETEDKENIMGTVAKSEFFDLDVRQRGQSLVEDILGFAGGGTDGPPSGRRGVHRNEQFALPFHGTYLEGVAKPRRTRTKRKLREVELAKSEAEQVRESFKAKKAVVPEVETPQGASEEVANAHKYERRLKMNRQSAAASRVRRDAYIRALEKHLAALEAKYIDLQEEYEASKEQTAMLRSLVAGQGVHGVDPAVDGKQQEDDLDLIGMNGTEVSDIDEFLKIL